MSRAEPRDADDEQTVAVAGRNRSRANPAPRGQTHGVTASGEMLVACGKRLVGRQRRGEGAIADRAGDAIGAAFEIELEREDKRRQRRAAFDDDLRGARGVERPRECVRLSAQRQPSGKPSGRRRRRFEETGGRVRRGLGLDEAVVGAAARVERIHAEVRGESEAFRHGEAERRSRAFGAARPMIEQPARRRFRGDRVAQTEFAPRGAEKARRDRAGAGDLDEQRREHGVAETARRFIEDARRCASRLRTRTVFTQARER